MHINFKKLLIVVTLLAAPTVCMANPYITGTIGSASWKEDLKEIDDSTSFEIGGGYQFNDNIAAEVTYLDSGDGSISEFGAKADFNLNGITASAVGILPLSEQFSLYGKLGLFLWDLDVTASAGGFSGSGSTDGTDIIYGVGASWSITSAMQLHAEYRVFTGSAEEDGEDFDVGVSILGVGAKFLF